MISFIILPDDLIARVPLPSRSQSRLMILNRAQKSIQHGIFTDILQLLEPDDLIVFNNSRVIPARLHGHKDTGGKVEILVERIRSSHSALAMLSASKAPKPEAKFLFLMISPLLW